MIDSLERESACVFAVSATRKYQLLGISERVCAYQGTQERVDGAPDSYDPLAHPHLGRHSAHS
eukprot:2284265-Pleurochrysis_carterae.AAC.2